MICLKEFSYAKETLLKFKIMNWIINFFEIAMNIKNQIKAHIMFAGFTMAEVVDALSTEYGWSDSLSNFSAKLSRGSLRYKEALELADVLGYEIVWQKRKDNG